MIVKNKEMYVARGIVTFARSLMNQHHVDKNKCVMHLINLLKEI